MTDTQSVMPLSMSEKRTKWLLWLGGVLLLPLPYLFMYEGAVPVVRYAMLTIITATYSVLIDGSAVAWPMTFILAAHTLLFAAVLLSVAALAARWIPEQRRTQAVVALFAVGFAIAMAFPIYTTPADDVSAHANWIGLFQ
jgi:hypothetical protein